MRSSTILWPRLRGCVGAVVGALWLSGCGAAARGGLEPTSGAVGPNEVEPPPHVLSETVVSPYSDAELAEQFAEAQQLLLSDQASEAAAMFDRLVRFSPTGRTAAPSLFNAGLSYLVMGDHATALERFQAQIDQFPEAPTTRNALIRTTRVLAYLERWKALDRQAAVLLRREDLAMIERIEAFGARALGLVEQGRVEEAAVAVRRARDLIEDNRLGEAGAPPIELAQVHFALGEIRRAESERIDFDPMPDDFVDVLERRCQGLLDAQSAYSDAMRSLDAHWSAMAGFRVGQLYQQLHRDVMAIPPPVQAETLRQKQLFEGAMRLRYRVLLTKGLEMMRSTLAMAERTGEQSVWVRRAAEAQRELELALEDEATAMSKLPFTEKELQEALDALKN